MYLTLTTAHNGSPVKETSKQTDRQTDRQTEKKTEKQRKSQRNSKKRRFILSGEIYINQRGL